MKLAKIGIIAVVLTLASIPCWAGLASPCEYPQIFYCHTFDQTGTAYSSQNDTNGLGLFAQVYDDFYLVQHVSGIHWVGEYFNPAQHGQITGWTISVYNDNSGPGSLYLTQHITGNAYERFIGNFNGFPTYEYSFYPLGGWSFDGSKGYWLSVVPDLGFPPQWGWSTASNAFGDCDQCDAVAFQDFFGTRSDLPVDFAFSFSDVPEPGTIMMFGTGLLGLAGVLRRKLF